jgi:hypothetical protein
MEVRYDSRMGMGLVQDCTRQAFTDQAEGSSPERQVVRNEQLEATQEWAKTFSSVGFHARRANLTADDGWNKRMATAPSIAK